MTDTILHGRSKTRPMTRFAAGSCLTRTPNGWVFNHGGRTIHLHNIKAKWGQPGYSVVLERNDGSLTPSMHSTQYLDNAVTWARKFVTSFNSYGKDDFE